MFSPRGTSAACVSSILGSASDQLAVLLASHREADALDALQRRVADDRLPHTLNVCLRPLTAHCPEARASGIYTAIPDTDKFRVSPEWHARHHGYRICICPQYMTWKLVAGNGVCVAETLPRVDQSTRLGVALPHARDVEWRSCNANVVGSFEVSVVGEMRAGKEAVERMRQRLQGWREAASRGKAGFRHGFLTGAGTERGDIVEMSNRVLCGLRAMAKVGGEGEGARTYVLRRYLKRVRVVQRCFRRWRATRNARLGSLLEAWREQDLAASTRLRQRVRRSIEVGSMRRDDLSRKEADISRVTDDHRRAALVSLYTRRSIEWKMARKGAVSHYLDTVLPCGAETIAAARKMLEKLTERWVRRRCDAERGELVPPSPNVEGWLLTWAEWAPDVADLTPHSTPGLRPLAGEPHPPPPLLLSSRPRGHSFRALHGPASAAMPSSGSFRMPPSRSRSAVGLGGKRAVSFSRRPSGASERSTLGASRRSGSIPSRSGSGRLGRCDSIATATTTATADDAEDGDDNATEDERGDSDDESIVGSFMLPDIQRVDSGLARECTPTPPQQHLGVRMRCSRRASPGLGVATAAVEDDLVLLSPEAPSSVFTPGSSNASLRSSFRRRPTFSTPDDTPVASVTNSPQPLRPSKITPPPNPRKGSTAGRSMQRILDAAATQAVSQRATQRASIQPMLPIAQPTRKASLGRLIVD